MSRFRYPIIGLLLILISGFATLNQIVKAEVNEQLTEVQKLKAENFQLRVQLAQCNATISDREARLKSAELTAEQQNLLNEFRIQLKANEKDTFDWTTLTFTSSSSK